MRSTTAEACADAFVEHWVARFGVPHTITTDRGPQFTSAVWKCLCKTIGTRHILTTAYHPQSNGMVERFHRQLKDALRARGSKAAWLEHLPWALLGLRAAPKEDAEISSSEAVYGTPLAVPNQALQLVSQQAVCQEEKERPPPLIELWQRSYAEAVAGRKSILEGASHVYVRRGAVGSPLAETYSGPYEILRRREKTVLLRLGQREEWVSADRLKPHLGTSATPVEPPRRGRPLGVSGGV